MRRLSGVGKWVRSQYLGEVLMYKEYEFGHEQKKIRVNVVVSNEIEERKEKEGMQKEDSWNFML